MGAGCLPRRGEFAESAVLRRISGHWMRLGFGWMCGIASPMASFRRCARRLTPVWTRRSKFLRVVCEEAAGRILVGANMFPLGVTDCIDVLTYGKSVGVTHAFAGLPRNFCGASAMRTLSGSSRRWPMRRILPLIVYGVAAPNTRHLHPSGFPVEAYDEIADFAECGRDEADAADRYRVGRGTGGAVCRSVADSGRRACRRSRCCIRRWAWQWTGQWVVESLQSPERPYLVEFMAAMAKHDYRGGDVKLYWTMAPAYRKVHEVQEPYLLAGSHPWVHINYYHWLTGGNGGVAAGRAPGGHDAVLTAADRASIRSGYEALGIEMRDNEEEFVVWARQLRQGVSHRRSRLDRFVRGMRRLVPAAFLAAGGVRDVTKLGPRTSSLGWSAAGGNAGLFLAAQEGYFAAEGLEVAIHAVLMPRQRWWRRWEPGKSMSRSGRFRRRFFNGIERHLGIRIIASLARTVPNDPYFCFAGQEGFDRNRAVQGLCRSEGAEGGIGCAGGLAFPRCSTARRRPGGFGFPISRRCFLPMPQQVIAMQKGLIDVTYIVDPFGSEIVSDGAGVRFASADAVYSRLSDRGCFFANDAFPRPARRGDEVVAGVFCGGRGCISIRSMPGIFGRAPRRTMWSRCWRRTLRVSPAQLRETTVPSNDPDARINLASPEQ